MTKNKKALIVAGAAALGLVAATGVTSGLAWFATNSTVTVTGLAVSANTTDAFLLISSGHVETAAAVRTANDTAAAVGSNVSLMPVHYESTYTISEIEKTTRVGETDVYNYNWGTATSNNVNESQGSNARTPISCSTGSTNAFATDIAGANKYVSMAEFSLCLATGSAGCTGLKVSATTLEMPNPDYGSEAPEAVQPDKEFIDSDFDVTGLSVIIATSYAGENYIASGTQTTTIWNTAMTATDTTPVYVKAYVYIDGTSAGVKTAAVDNLTGKVGFKISTLTA